MSLTSLTSHVISVIFAIRMVFHALLPPDRLHRWSTSGWVLLTWLTSSSSGCLRLTVELWNQHSDQPLLDLLDCSVVPAVKMHQIIVTLSLKWAQSQFCPGFQWSCSCFHLLLPGRSHRGLANQRPRCRMLCWRALGYFQGQLLQCEEFMEVKLCFVSKLNDELVPALTLQVFPNRTRWLMELSAWLWKLVLLSTTRSQEICSCTRLCPTNSERPECSQAVTQGKRGEAPLGPCQQTRVALNHQLRLQEVKPSCCLPKRSQACSLYVVVQTISRQAQSCLALHPFSISHQQDTQTTNFCFPPSPSETSSRGVTFTRCQPFNPTAR